MTALDSLLGFALVGGTVAAETYFLSGLTDAIGPEGVALTGGISLSSTILNEIEVPNDLCRVQDAISYVESLSDEVLAKADQLLIGKEFEFELPYQQTIENDPLVYVKTNKNKI